VNRTHWLRAHDVGHVGHFGGFVVPAASSVSSEGDYRDRYTLSVSAGTAHGIAIVEHVVNVRRPGVCTTVETNTIRWDRGSNGTMSGRYPGVQLTRTP